MPELPEVETMVRGIRPFVTNRKIRNVEPCPNTCKPISITPSFKRLKELLVGQTFRTVRRIGKRVVFDVSSGHSLVIEPRMTGLMLLSDPPDIEHLRVRWDFQGRSSFDSLWFWDRRGLGTMTLMEPGGLETRFGLENFGRDALEMTVSTWTECCRKTQRAIKVMLLDQKFVAGIGNLYASEILHLAAINPITPANALKRKAIERLDEAVRSVLHLAIECEGSTLGDGTYRNALNQSGKFQNEHRAYMRDGKPCLTCRQSNIVRIVQAQRSTFLCPRCQKVSIQLT